MNNHVVIVLVSASIGSLLTVGAWIATEHGFVFPSNVQASVTELKEIIIDLELCKQSE